MAKYFCINRFNTNLLLIKLLPEEEKWLDFNKEMSKVGAPVITKVKDPMPTFEEASKYTADEQWSKVSRIPFVNID